MRPLHVRYFWWLLAPACLVLCAAYPTFDALLGLSYAPLGRDQGIFQYTAWALRNGQRMYTDFHEINGPFPHAMHWLFQLLGGETDKAFRRLDIYVTLATYFWIGTRIPREGSPRGSRWAWGLAASLCFGSQYVSLGWWHTAQREHYFTLLIGLAIGALLPELREAAPSTRKVRLARWFVAGVCIAAPCFGKPTCAAYVGLFVVAAFWLQRRRTPERVFERQNIVAFAAGLVVVSLGFLAFIVRHGDLAGCWKYVVVETTRFHRYFWLQSLRECYFAYGNAPRLNIAFVTLVLVLVVAARKNAPSHVALAAVPLVGGLVTYFAQQKGFAYHLHPVTFGTRLVWLLLVEHWASSLSTVRLRELPKERCVSLICVLGLTVWYANGDASCADSRNPLWRSGEESELQHLRHFRSRDFQPDSIVEAAEYLKATLQPNDRVQLYGFDPYLLFRARKLSASPFIYSFDLQARSVLESKKVALSSETRSWIETLLAENREALAENLNHALPAAFVFIDRTPFDYPDDAQADFAACCVKANALVEQHYRPARQFGTVRVWLRKELSPE